jgi:hypothetical protein
MYVLCPAGFMYFSNTCRRTVTIALQVSRDSHTMMDLRCSDYTCQAPCCKTCRRDLSDTMLLKAIRQQRHAEGTMMMQINEVKASVNLCNTITDVGEDDDLSDGELAAVSMPLLRVCVPLHACHNLQMPTALQRCTRHGQEH